jgi:poly(hydroxyalkanoate) depolymerase family esterase
MRAHALTRGVQVMLLVTSLGCAGRTSTGTPAAASTVRGTVRSAAGERGFVRYRPAWSGVSRPASGALVVMLHGCTQDADDAARGTRLSEWADREGFIVLYPEQPRSANATRCWNWFVPGATTRGDGEVALLAGLIDSVARAEGVQPQRVALVGMSAGAAMAASIAIAYPRLAGALVLHSGVPAGSARDLASAVQVMRQGVADVDALGWATHAAMGDGARPIRVLLIHGGSDPVVAPANLEVIARQWAIVNAASAGESVGPVTDVAERVPSTVGHRWAGRRITDAARRTSVEWWRVEGVGHAWSGGSPSGTFTAPAGPDASALLVQFLAEVWAGR